jgi:hypothetical protein
MDHYFHTVHDSTTTFILRQTKGCTIKTSQPQHFYPSPGIWFIVTSAQQIQVGKEGKWMTVSDCCGAQTKVEYRPDRPFVYDDRYELLVPMLVCTKCEKIIGLYSDNPSEDPEP